MTDWKPKPGDKVMVFKPDYVNLAYGDQVVGQVAEFKTQVMSGNTPVAVVEYDGGCYCFRMDMIAQPVDPRREVLEMVFDIGVDMGGREHGLGLTPEQIFKNSVILDALRKLDNLPPF